jgi:hypothetical protein
MILARTNTVDVVAPILEAPTGFYCPSGVVSSINWIEPPPS